MEEDASQFSQLTYSQISPVDLEEKELWELLQKVQQKRTKREFLATRYSQNIKGQAWKIEQLEKLVKDQEKFLISAREDFTKLQELKKNCEINNEYIREDIAVTKAKVEEKTDRLLKWQTDLQQAHERSINAITEARDFKNQITNKPNTLMTKHLEMEKELYKINELMNCMILQLENKDNDDNNELRTEIKEYLLKGTDKKERDSGHDCIMQKKLFQKLPQKRHPFLDALEIAGCRFERAKEKSELGNEHFQAPMETADVENIKPTSMEVLDAKRSVKSDDLTTNDDFEIAMICDQVMNNNTVLTDDSPSEHTSKNSLKLIDREIVNQEKFIKHSYSAGLQSIKAVSAAPDMDIDKPCIGASVQNGSEQTYLPSCELEDGLSINYNMENYLQEMFLRNRATFEKRNKDDYKHYTIWDENSHIDKVHIELKERGESAEGEREIFSSALPKKDSTVSESTDISMESFTFKPKEKKEIQKSGRQCRQQDIYRDHHQIIKNDMGGNFSLKNKNDFQGIAKHVSENSLAHSFAEPIHSTREFLNSFKLSKHDEYMKLFQQPDVSDFPDMHALSPSSEVSNDEDVKSATIPNSKLPPAVLSSPECEESDAVCREFKFPDNGESLLELKQQLEKWKTSMSEPLGPAPNSLAVIPHFSSEYHLPMTKPQFPINRGHDGDVINVLKGITSNSTVQHISDVKCLPDLLKPGMSSDIHSPVKLDEDKKYRIHASPYQPALRTTSDHSECENLGSKRSFRQQKSYANEKPVHFSWDVLKECNKEMNQKMPRVIHLMVEDEDKNTDTEITQSLDDLELTSKDEKNSILQSSTLTLSSALKSLKHGYFQKEFGANNFFSGISKKSAVFSATKELENSSKGTSLGLCSKASSSNGWSNCFGAQNVRENGAKVLKSEELQARLPFNAARNFGVKAIETKMLEMKQEIFVSPLLMQQSSADLVIPPTEFCQSEMPCYGKSGNNKEKQDKQNHYEISHVSAMEAEDDVDIEKPYNLLDEPVIIHNASNENSLPMDIDSAVLQAPCNTPKDDSESNETIDVKSSREKELQNNADSTNQEMYNSPSSSSNNPGLNMLFKYSEAVPKSVPLLSLMSENSEMTDLSDEDKSMSIQQLLENQVNPSVNYKETAPSTQNIHQQEKSQNLDSMETDTIVLSSDNEEMPSTCSLQFIKEISKFSVDSPYWNSNKNVPTTQRTLRDTSECSRFNKSRDIEQETPPHQFVYQKISPLCHRNFEFDNNPNYKKTASLNKNVPQLVFNVTEETSGVAQKGKENRSLPPLPEMKQGSAKKATDFSACNYPSLDTEKETGKLKHDKIKTISEIMNETQNQPTATKDAAFSYDQLEDSKLVPQEKVSKLIPLENSYDSKRNSPFNMNQAYLSDDYATKAPDKYFRNLMSAYDLQIGPLSMTSDVSTFDPNCSTQNTAKKVTSPLNIRTPSKKSKTYVPFDFEKYMKPLSASPESASPFQMTFRNMFSSKNTATFPSSQMTGTMQTPGLQSIADIVKGRNAARKD